MVRYVQKSCDCRWLLKTIDQKVLEVYMCLRVCNVSFDVLAHGRDAVPWDPVGLCRALFDKLECEIEAVLTKRV